MNRRLCSSKRPFYSLDFPLSTLLLILGCSDEARARAKHGLGGHEEIQPAGVEYL